MKKKVRAGVIGTIMGVLVFVGLLIWASNCTTFISPGEAGVVYGVSGGVHQEALDTGFHFISFTDKVKKFRVSNEQLIIKENKDEIFAVSTSDEAILSIDFQMTYYFDQATLPKTYEKFRGLDGDDIIENRVKSVLKAKVSEITSKYSLMDLYSGNRAPINTELTKYLNDNFYDSYGIFVTDASIIDTHPDKQLKQAISDRLAAVQEKQKAEAESETKKVQRQIAKDDAENAADIAKIEAESKAKVKEIEANAEANANKALSKSISPELIKMKEAEARLKHGWVTIQGADTVVKQ